MNMLHRQVIVCHEDEKIWAHALLENLAVSTERSVIKDIKRQQDIEQVFSGFMVPNDISVYLMTDKSSTWMLQRLEENDKTIQRRGLVVIPVLMGNFKIPFDFFSRLPIISSTGDMKELAGRVSKVIRNFLTIDFAKITPMNFEILVKDVLKANRFEGITLTYSEHVDFGYDMMCTFTNEKAEVEKWMVEVKYARESRFTISGIDQIIKQDRGHYLADHKLMLVTNGFFTSVITAYLGAVMVDKGISIYVVDGWKLRNLIAHNNNLVDEYFPYE